MNLLHVIIVLSVLLVITVVVGLILTYRTNRKKHLADCRKHPEGEPIWYGRLPTVVFDYTEPRYVYENLVESTDYLPENGRIIGYRISPDLVIHSTIVNEIYAGDFKHHIKMVGGKLMDYKDVNILLDNWKQISNLRQKAGSSPLCCYKLILGTHERDLVAFDIECLSSPQIHLRMNGFHLNPSFYTEVSLVLKR